MGMVPGLEGEIGSDLGIPIGSDIGTRGGEIGIGMVEDLIGWGSGKRGATTGTGEAINNLIIKEIIKNMSAFYDILQPAACNKPSLNLYCNSITAATGGVGEMGPRGPTGPTGPAGGTISYSTMSEVWTWTGPWNKGLTGIVSYTQIGNIVNLTLGALTGVSITASEGSVMLTSNKIPEQYKPGVTNLVLRY